MLHLQCKHNPISFRRMNFLTLKLLHLSSLVLLLGASIYKNILLSPAQVPNEIIKKVLLADKLSGLAAALMVATGVGMLMNNMPAHLFRLQQTTFWIKMTILVLASLLIIVTKRYLRKVAADSTASNIAVPSYIRRILRIDILSLLLMIMLAVAMVRT